MLLLFTDAEFSWSYDPPSLFIMFFFLIHSFITFPLLAVVILFYLVLLITSPLFTPLQLSLYWRILLGLNIVSTLFLQRPIYFPFSISLSQQKRKGAKKCIFSLRENRRKIQYVNLFCSFLHLVAENDRRLLVSNHTSDLIHPTESDNATKTHVATWIERERKVFRRYQKPNPQQEIEENHSACSKNRGGV